MSIKDYEIIKTIGKGSFGKIYEVEHKKTKKHYALKKIETEGLSEEDLDLIEQEIKMLIQMECEYSTELIKDFRDDEYVYIILELCDSTFR
jgi:serine/threonine protein kinase